MTAHRVCRVCRSSPAAPGPDQVCPTCHITATAAVPSPIEDQLQPGAWAWTTPGAGPALASGQLGAILRAWRVGHHLTQATAAARLGYDPSYISLLETGRRQVHDVATRRHLARSMGIPAYLLGVTEDDGDHAGMLAYAQSTIRLAELARSCGRAAAAVDELWPLVARLESRLTQTGIDPDTLAVLGQAWTSLGVALGTVLPEERLWVAARWTGKGLAAAQHLPDHHHTAAALRMHGNELRKAGDLTQAIPLLQDSVARARTPADQAAGWALLARAAAADSNPALFTQALTARTRLLDQVDPTGLAAPLVSWEIRLRGLHDLADHTAALDLAHNPAPGPAPAPQWDVIAKITTADVLTTAGDHLTAEQILSDAITTATNDRLPHQIQRAARTARRAGHHHLVHRAHTALADLGSSPRPRPLGQ